MINVKDVIECARSGRPLCSRLQVHYSANNDMTQMTNMTILGLVTGQLKIWQARVTVDIVQASSRRMQHPPL